MDSFAVFSSFFATEMDKVVLKMLNHPQKVRLVAHLSVVDKRTNNTCSMMMVMTMPTFIPYNSINLNAQCSEGFGGRWREGNREKVIVIKIKEKEKTHVQSHSESRCVFRMQPRSLLPRLFVVEHSRAWEQS